MAGLMVDVTRILSAIEDGDGRAAEQLLPIVYDELRRLAAQRLMSERPGQTLQATALVHEAYLRLVGNDNAPQWDGRGHFFAAAAEAMRRILVDTARRKQAVKHGGNHKRIDLDAASVTLDAPSDEMLGLNQALDRLSGHDPQKAKLVELRFFAGLTNDEAAAVLGLSPATARRHWRYARAWLRREIKGG
jgi:RNA polymerase sigma factor (TIGR02999 family)